VEVDREDVVVSVGGEALVRVGLDGLVLRVVGLSEVLGVGGRVAFVIAERGDVPAGEAAGLRGNPRTEAAALLRDEAVEERTLIFLFLGSNGGRGDRGASRPTRSPASSRARVRASSGDGLREQRTAARALESRARLRRRWFDWVSAVVVLRLCGQSVG